MFVSADVKAFPLLGTGFTVTITGEDELPFALFAFNMKVYVPGTVRPDTFVTGDDGEAITGAPPEGIVPVPHDADTLGALASLTEPVSVTALTGKVIDWFAPALETGGG